MKDRQKSLKQYLNLKEKYIRGQKDFDEKTWHRLDMYYKSRINLKGE